MLLVVFFLIFGGYIRSNLLCIMELAVVYYQNISTA